MNDRSCVVENLARLTPAEQAAAFLVPDFMERPASCPAFRVDDLYQRGYVAYADESRERPLGRISVFPRRLLPYRDPGTGAAKLLSAGLVEFPVTALIEPAVWDLLFAQALADTPVAGVYLPPEYHRHIDYLARLGFVRYADDVDTPRSLYVRHDPAAGPRSEVYPISPATNLMRTANAASALWPDSTAWGAVDNYSGFSGYPWLTTLLDRLLGQPRRLLSMPAGTGDVVRLLPERVLRGLELCVGVDVLDRNIRFARARVAEPSLDALNTTLCATFLEAQVTDEPEPALALLAETCAAAGRPVTDRECADLYVQLRAAAEQALTCGGIADWFALTKGIARFVAGADTVTGAADALEAGVALAQKIGADWSADSGLAQLRDRGGIRFETGDMFTYREPEPFDTIFVWEALLIVAGAGRQQEYVDAIDGNLAPGGTVVMTGIRREDGRWGRDLEIVEEQFRRHGYATVLTNVSPPTDRWARGYLAQPVFPVLMAKKKA